MNSQVDIVFFLITCSLFENMCKVVVVLFESWFSAELKLYIYMIYDRKFGLCMTFIHAPVVTKIN